MQRIVASITLAAFPLAAFASARQRTAPSYVDITWMSVTNMYYEIGPLRIVTDGYITRLPQSAFFGGASGLASTRLAFKPNVAAVKRVLDALGGPAQVNLLLTGHSHFDHSFDTAVWSNLTGARIIGSSTTCFQTIAQHIPADRCTTVFGGEKIPLADGVMMYVVRFNHSGDPAKNPEQHNAVELTAPPVPDSTGGLHAGLAEDFPNGGGNRGYLFVVDGAGSRFSWFFVNSASAVDLDVPIVIDGRDYGAPIENLKKALKDADVGSVDLWIGPPDRAVAQRLLPVLRPRAFLPVHWDSFWRPFEAGVPRAFADSALEQLLTRANAQLIRPVQYMDKWRLDRTGVRPWENAGVKKALGF